MEICKTNGMILFFAAVLSLLWFQSTSRQPTPKNVYIAPHSRIDRAKRDQVSLSNFDSSTHTRVAGNPQFTLLTTAFGGFTSKYELPLQLKHCYALKHGYQHILDTSEPSQTPANATKHPWINQGFRKMYKHKIDVLRKYLPLTEYLVMVDADLIVHSFTTKLDQFIDPDHDVWIMDGFEQSSSAWIVRNSEYGRRFVDHLLRTFDLNDDDQCGFANLMVTIARRKSSNKEPLPLSMEPEMPCGYQERMIARLNAVAKCIERELNERGRPYASIEQQGYRSIDRIKLLNPFEDTERLMVYCCHGAAPKESRFLRQRADLMAIDVKHARSNGTDDPALFVSGRKGEKNYEMLLEVHADDARLCRV